MNLSPRTTPTFYFVGVSTAQSSIMKVFPRWAQILGLDVQIAGVDAPLHAPPETYRTIVQHIKTDPKVYGALVTTHKIDLFEATRDLFDYLDPNALLCGEISCISKRDGELRGHAKDPISSGLSWKAFVPEGHFARTNAEVLCFGSGGAAVALSVYLANAPDRPRRFTLVDISQSRLEHARHIHAQLSTDIVFDYILNDDALENDRRMSSFPSGSVVVNATGMGKDRPGSPVTDAGIFPQDGFAWEMNYRGELNFLHQAQRQSRNLKIEDGWVYFLHGWTQVIAEVFNIDLTPELFTRLDESAR
ncbi:MAG: shikimate dehydrogenase [Anaerolineae bacterium]|nr:shikimate dehydrogenase [Anaerolineae bacterium]